MQLLRDFFAFEPGMRDREAAIRCTLGVIAPLVLLMLIGRPDLTVFAVFGAFTGVYGRNMDFNERVATQVRAGGLMVAVIGLAVASHTLFDRLNPWQLVAATTLVAGVAASFARLWVLRPSGSLFHIFAFAAIASLPAAPPAGQAMTTAALTALLGVAVGAAWKVRPGVRPRWHLPSGVYTLANVRDALKDGLMNALVAGVAGFIAVAVGLQTGFGHHYWAMVAAVVPLQALRARHAVFRGTQRILGALLGLIPLGIVLALHLDAWGTVAAVAVCQFMVELLVIRQYLLAQMFVTPLALLSISLAGRASPAGLLGDRIVETAIGSLVGMAVLLAVRYPDRVAARLPRRGRRASGPRLLR